MAELIFGRRIRQPIKMYRVSKIHVHDTDVLTRGDVFRRIAMSRMISKRRLLLAGFSLGSNSSFSMMLICLELIPGRGVILLRIFRCKHDKNLTDINDSFAVLSAHTDRRAYASERQRRRSRLRQHERKRRNRSMGDFVSSIAVFSYGFAVPIRMFSSPPVSSRPLHEPAKTPWKGALSLNRSSEKLSLRSCLGVQCRRRVARKKNIDRDQD